MLHRHQLRVRFAETDEMGVAHHSAYVVWLEAARIEWLRALDLSYRELEDSGVSLAVSELSVTYRAACRFDDLLTIETELTAQRSRRVSFSYRIVRPHDSLLIATATTTLTPTDRSGRAVRLSSEWLARLAGPSV